MFDIRVRCLYDNIFLPKNLPYWTTYAPKKDEKFLVNQEGWDYLVTKQMTPKVELVTGQDEASQDEAGEDEAGQDEAGQDEASQDEAGEDEAGQDEAGEDAPVETKQRKKSVKKARK